MGFPIVSLHQAYRPRSQINWGPLGGLHKRIAFLQSVSYQCLGSLLKAQLT